MSPARCWWCALVLGASIVLSSTVVDAQQLPQHRLVDSGEPPWPEASIGQAIPIDGTRPAALGVLRSTRALVSVHVGDGVDMAIGRAALAHAEYALDRLEFTHHFAPPLPDGTRGGDPTLDVYVMQDGPAVRTEVDALDATWLWDRASAFVRVRSTTSDHALRRYVTEGIARAIVLAHKADHPAALVAAAGSSMARLVTGDAADPDALRAFQATPGRAIFGSDVRSDAEARGASVFFDYVDARWDDHRHNLLRGMIGAPVGYTAAGSTRLWNEPDAFDVFRRMFREEPGRVEQAFMDFSVARALVGTPSDRYNTTGLLDPTLAVRPLRTLRYGELPRRVHSVTPLEPTGCAVVAVDLSDAPIHAAMAVWFHGAPWHQWMVRAVRIHGDGHVAGDLGSDVITDGEWSLQLDVLDGYTSVLLVVTNLGDRTYDPDLYASPSGFFSLNVGRGG